MNTAYKTISTLTLALALTAALSSTRAAAATKMDLNTAPEANLMQMPSVNKQMAKNIIAHRPYATVNDLSKAGFHNEAMLAKLAEWCIQPYKSPSPRVAGGTSASGGTGGFGNIAQRQ